jgi:hypothetical protein
VVGPEVLDEPAATAPEVAELLEPASSTERAPEQELVVLSPIPVAATSFSVLDSGSPMPELLPEDGSIFASMKSNWFNSDGAEQPWDGHEVDTGWEAAERVAEATPLQISESGLPVRRPGARIVPGGVQQPAATLVRDPEAIRARLAAHAAGVNRGRRVVGDPVHVDSDHSDHQEVDPS